MPAYFLKHHPISVVLNSQLGNPPLQLENLIKS